jgi:anti-sigma regulatory factor (Ser/Thr protein kinase)
MERERTTPGRPGVPFQGMAIVPLPADATAPGQARRTLAALLGSGDVRLSAALLAVSELVTNAVRHGDRTGTGTIELRVATTAGGLRVSVGSAGPGFSPAPVRRGTAGGWGLGIVAAVTRSWGVEEERGPTVVWFEL